MTNISLLLFFCGQRTGVLGLLRNFWNFISRRAKHSSGATLYIHYPCFDGLISGVIAWEFLENNSRWVVRHVSPVNYNLRNTWLSTPLNSPSAIVDFLYHPQAAFWVDHHLTSFINDSVKRDFEQRRSTVPLIYDNLSGSSASLLWKCLGKNLPNSDQFVEMVSWAEKIDSAAYSSVEEAVLGDAPAMRINFSLMAKDATTKTYCEHLLKLLRHSRSLAEVADSRGVSKKYKYVERRMRRGLDYLRDRLTLLGDMVAFDVEADDSMIISRYAPYYFSPNSSYSIGITRYPHGAKITAMRNPWRNFESVPLGTIFARFGGGGHQRVASVFLQGQNAGEVEVVADQLLRDIREYEQRMRRPASEALFA